MTNKPVVLFLILTSFLFQRAQAQALPTDSLHQVLQQYPVPLTFQVKDTAYFRTANLLVARYIDVLAFDSIRIISNEALALVDRAFKTLKDPFVVNRLEFYKMRFFRYLGIADHQSGDYVSGLKNFQQYLLYAEKYGSIKDIGSANTNMAFCHRELGDYQLAFAYAQKSFHLLKDTPHQGALANNYSVFSIYYLEVKADIDSAIYFSKEGIRVAKTLPGPLNQVNAVFDLVIFFALRQQADSSLLYLEQIKPIVFKYQFPDMIARYHYLLGEALYTKGHIKEAMQHLRQAETIAEELQNPQYVFNIQKFFALAQAAGGQTAASLQSLNKAIEAYDQDLNTENVRKINSAQLNYEFDKKEALANIELQKQKTIKEISLLGLALGFIVVLLLFRLYSQSKKTARILSEKNTQIEKSYRELKETQEQLVLTEKQREAQSIRVRIARDIHDELGAGLTKITMLSDFVRRKLRSNNEEVAHSLQRIIEHSKGVSAALGEIVWAVNPSHDTLESLSAYLKSYTVYFLDGTDIHFECSMPADIPNQHINPELKRNIFLVLKEALNNAVKYAKADNILVGFQVEEGRFKLGIRDDGRGFHPDETNPANGSGNGLLNMKNRMEQFGCQLLVITAPGQGCTIEASGNLV